jgi:hypothetical protein
LGLSRAKGSQASEFPAFLDRALIAATCSQATIIDWAEDAAFVPTVTALSSQRKASL